MKKVYLFLIYYLMGLAIYNGIIFVLDGQFELSKSFLLPLIAVSLVLLSNENKKRNNNNAETVFIYFYFCKNLSTIYFLWKRCLFVNLILR